MYWPIQSSCLSWQHVRNVYKWKAIYAGGSGLQKASAFHKETHGGCTTLYIIYNEKLILEETGFLKLKLWNSCGMKTLKQF